MRDEEGCDGGSMLQRVMATASTAAQSVIDHLAQLVEMSERWAVPGPERSVEGAKMNFAHCLEDAIQQSETWERSFKA